MNELSKEKTMTVKEVSEILNVNPETIKSYIRELYPDIMQNGKTTYLTEIQVTRIKMSMDKNPHLQRSLQVNKTELEKDLIIAQAYQILQDRIQILTEQKEQAEKQVKMLVHDFNKLYTTTEISKELNLKSAQELNNLLHDNKIQFKQSGTWVLYSDYSDKGYTSIKETVLDSGKVVYDRLWTGLGRQFILNLFEAK